MGIDFRIGNAYATFEADYHNYVASVYVREAYHPNAPCFPNDNPDTRFGNCGNMSYGGWNEFCNEAGFSPEFLKRLTGSHPDCGVVNYEMTAYVAMCRYRRQLTVGRPAGYVGSDACDPGKYDWVLARLIWMEGWFNWALRNCENPGFYNG